MRCPKCNHNQLYKNGMTCGQCGYKFVLNPKGSQLRDKVLCEFVSLLSDNGRYFFTKEQLVIGLCRRFTELRWGCAWFLAITGIAIAVGAFLDLLNYPLTAWLAGIGTFILLAVLLHCFRYRFSRTASYADITQKVERYHKIHPFKNMVDGSAFAENAGLEEDHLHFAPDRILVVERNEWVDFLVLNRFPQTTKTAVVSISGYPQAVFAACRRFLERNPNIPVQVLHDGSKFGEQHIRQLRQDPNWGFARKQFSDIGLSSQQLSQHRKALPWLEPKRKKLIFTSRHQDMWQRNYRMPLDFSTPKGMLGLLSSAVVAGAFSLPLLSEWTFGLEIEDDFG